MSQLLKLSRWRRYTASLKGLMLTFAKKYPTNEFLSKSSNGFTLKNLWNHSQCQEIFDDVIKAQKFSKEKSRKLAWLPDFPFNQCRFWRVDGAGGARCWRVRRASLIGASCPFGYSTSIGLDYEKIDCPRQTTSTSFIALAILVRAGLK